MPVDFKYIYFTQQLIAWNKKNNTRIMPWKGEKNPYKVWLSEIILQQTRVEQGIDYYNRFILTYPTLNDLANAGEDHVLKLWQGLGYYSRARNLLFTAQYVRDELNGLFPDNYEDLLRLKGVGEYTAAAISSFCFNEVKAVVDGNVIRVLSRFFKIEEVYNTAKGKKRFRNLAQKLIDEKNPAHYNQAIMDFGATICKPKLASCQICVLQNECEAYKTNTVYDLPIKKKKTPLKKRYFFSYLIETAEGYVVEQRQEDDIWKKLYQLPTIEVPEYKKNKRLQSKNIATRIAAKKHIVYLKVDDIYTQKLSHQHIHIQFVLLRVSDFTILNREKHRYTKNLTKFAFPKIYILFLKSKNLILESNN